MEFNPWQPPPAGPAGDPWAPHMGFPPDVDAVRAASAAAEKARADFRREALVEAEEIHYRPPVDGFAIASAILFSLALTSTGPLFPLRLPIAGLGLLAAAGSAMRLRRLGGLERGRGWAAIAALLNLALTAEGLALKAGLDWAPLATFR